MANEQGAENQNQTLILGRFKSEEEAKAHYEKVERESLELKEKLEQERRLNNLLATEDRTDPSPAKQTPAQLGLSSYLGEEGENAVRSVLDNYKSVLVEQVGRMVNNAVSQYRARQKAEERFYSSYKDLKGYEDIVDQQSDNIARDLGERLKVIPEEQFFSEVAKRTRDFVSNIANRANKQPLHLEAGTVSSPDLTTKTGNEGATKSSEEERTAQYFQDELKEHNEKRVRALR